MQLYSLKDTFVQMREVVQISQIENGGFGDHHGESV